MAEAKEVSAGLLSRAFRTPAPRALSLHNLLDLQPIAEDAGEPAGAAAAAPRGGGAASAEEEEGGSPGLRGPAGEVSSAARAGEGAANGSVPSGGGSWREGRGGDAGRPLASAGAQARMLLFMHCKRCIMCYCACPGKLSSCPGRVLPHVPSYLTTAVSASVPWVSLRLLLRFSRCVWRSSLCAPVHAPTHSDQLCGSAA